MYQLAAYTHFEASPYVNILKFDNTKEHYRVIRMYGWEEMYQLAAYTHFEQVHMLVY